MSRPTLKRRLSDPMQLSLPDYHRLRLPVPWHSAAAMGAPTQAHPVSLAATMGISLISSPAATEMFQFAACASWPYIFRQGRAHLEPRFPHLDTPGLQPQ